MASADRAAVRILILGTGNMAAQHAEKYAAHPRAKVVAAVDLDPSKLAAFCAQHNIATSFTDLDAAMTWGAFDAVSNVTPDAAHAPTCRVIMAAGKDVLCEKPLATRYADAADLATIAADKGVINMVNLSYRDVPVIQRAADLVARGGIGNLRHFEASYLQSWLTQAAWGDWRTDETWLWRLSQAHGSNGVLGDVGIHVLDFVTYVAGGPVSEVSCQLRTFDKASGDRIGPYTLDANDSCTMTLSLKNGALGVVSATRFASGHLNDLRLRIYGDAGGLDVSFENGVGVLRTCLGADMQTQTWTDVPCAQGYDLFDRFITAVQTRQPASPDFATGAQLQQVLDAAEASDADAGRRQMLLAQ